jgi:hypothetical protein
LKNAIFLVFTIFLISNANENSEGDPFKINEHFCKVAAINRKVVMEWKNKEK